MPERGETDPFKAIDEVVGSGPYRFLRTSFFQAAAPPGRVRRLRAGQEPAGMVQRRQIATFRESEWKIITDAATASAALQNGEVDWYEGKRSRSRAL